MSLIRPFTGLRPIPNRAAEVAAPPYDVVSTDEARALVTNCPFSFLHISRSEIDLSLDTDPYASEVYLKARENLDKMLKLGILQRDQAPCYYVYRLTMGQHSQTGLVVAASVAAYDAGKIKKHEFTRPAKEDDRVRQIEALNAQTGPVFLAYPSDPTIDNLLQSSAHGCHEFDLYQSGVRHELWVVENSKTIANFTALFDALPAMYVADGHHRSAAASRIAAARRQANPQHTGNESYNYFLAVVFPHTQLQILDYNRLIKDLNGLTENDFLSRLQEAWQVQECFEPARPTRSTEFGMYLNGKWYRLSIKVELIPADPVQRLDVSLLANHLIAPILGIVDQRRDVRIDFVGGIRGLGALEQRVNSGEMRLALALYPTRMTDLMAVADAGEVMPPKSTWFEPKLADGLVSHVLD